MLTVRISDNNTGADFTISAVQTPAPISRADISGSIGTVTVAPPARFLEWSKTLCDGERVSHADAEKACATLGDGWRLPTREELLSIVDLTRHEPAVDTERFPDTQSGAYWTSTPCAWASSLAWVVDFYGGGAYDCHRDSSVAFVRAVRSLPAGQ